MGNFDIVKGGKFPFRLHNHLKRNGMTVLCILIPQLGFSTSVSIKKQNVYTNELYLTFEKLKQHNNCEEIKISNPFIIKVHLPSKDKQNLSDIHWKFKFRTLNHILSNYTRVHILTT